MPCRAAVVTNMAHLFLWPKVPQRCHGLQLSKNSSRGMLQLPAVQSAPAKLPLYQGTSTEGPSTCCRPLRTSSCHSLQTSCTAAESGAAAASAAAKQLRLEMGAGKAGWRGLVQHAEAPPVLLHTQGPASCQAI